MAKRNIKGINELIGGSDTKKIEEVIKKEEEIAIKETLVPKCFKMKPSLHRLIKIEAVQRGIDMGVLLEEIVMQYFNNK